MNRTVRCRTLARLSLALVLGLVPAVTRAEGIVGHESECSAGGEFTLADPLTGVVLFATYQTNPGDLRRNSPTGATVQHIEGAGAHFTLSNAVGVLLAEGEGSFSLTTTIIPVDEDPCGWWFLDPTKTNVHVTAKMTDVLGGEFHLLVVAVVRDGEFRVLRLEQR